MKKENKQKLSIIDIATQLGVSKSTVSSVLNGKTEERRISEETRNVILDYIERSGFRPNAVARSLRTGNSKIIGMLVEDISNPFFASIAHLVEQKLTKEGYRILLSSTENDNENAAEALATFQDRQVDGYIIVPPSDLSGEMIRQIFRQKPLVIFDRAGDVSGASTVQIDNYNSMAFATRHLIESGYKNIGLISIESEQLQMLDRQRGYEDVLKENRLKAHIAKVDRRHSSENIKASIARFVTGHPAIDGIIFSTNYIALHGLQVLKSLHVNIPDAMGVISFDDSPYYELMTPTVTSIVQPVMEIADSIVQLLLAQIENKHNELTAPRSHQLDARLVKRASTARNR